MAQEPAFDVVIDDGAQPGTVLVAGIADIGAASLTAVDYLVDQLQTTPIGRIVTRSLPDVTPVTNGIPRHPIRLYNIEGSDITILLSEAFVPVWAADPLADALAEWTHGSPIDELTILYSAPFPHGEHEHVAFYVATEAYRAKYFVEGQREGLKPLAGGVFDGVVGELLVRGIEGTFPPVGVLVTPTHPPGPDFNAALTLLRGLESVYDVHVDEAELERRSEEIQEYYEDLVERLQTLREGDQPLGRRDFPDDRMFM